MKTTIRVSLKEILGVKDEPVQVCPDHSKGKSVILFQRGATSLGFQIGDVFWSINYPRYWRTSGPFGYHGVERPSFTETTQVGVGHIVTCSYQGVSMFFILDEQLDWTGMYAPTVTQKQVKRMTRAFFKEERSWTKK